MGITELAELLRAGLDEDERIAREACGSTVVGEPGNWRQAPGGDEWVAEANEYGDEELLVALRPGLPRPSDVMSGYWGAVVSKQADEREPGVRGPMDAFRHAARHDPARVLADVAARRQLLDQALAWEHYEVEDAWYCCPASAAYRKVVQKPPYTCDCGRDERVHAVLQTLAAPYRETP